jgi:O-acetyl-ADP-ribose deacetylase (regulator of RNase III)
MQVQVAGGVVQLAQGDITKETTEAIVNAANSSLMGGGGVDGAIHRAGGPSILEECKQIRARQGELPTGEAVITTGGNLMAKHVIHTVGPIWRGGDQGEPGLLESCYRSCMTLAREHGIKTLAFPSVSTGVYGYPVELAAPLALMTVVQEMAEHRGAFQLARWVLFDDKTYTVYADALADLDTVTVQP